MPILELKDVRYSYSPEKVVLRGVNCVFECGTLYALVGKSGAGKSTLLSLMAGLDLPESGQVLFEGTPTGDHGPGRIPPPEGRGDLSGTSPCSPC